MLNNPIGADILNPVVGDQRQDTGAGGQNRFVILAPHRQPVGWTLRIRQRIEEVRARLHLLASRWAVTKYFGENCGVGSLVR